MLEPMLISVVIPTHNRASVLPRALDSVRTQTLPPHEVIVVDDGSDDETAQLVHDRYPECRYLHQANQGVSSARNLGIAHSSGEWIALLDSDDAWLPEKLRLQAEALARNPDLRICHTEEIWIRNGVRVNPMRKHAKQGGRIFRRCLSLCVISPSSVVLHRSLFDDYGDFDSRLPACEDYDLWLRVCAHEEVLFIERPLIVKHGGHADQLSRRHWGMDRFRVQALEKILASPALSGADRRATLEILIEKAGIIAQGAEKRGQQTRAVHYRRLQSDYQTQLHRL
ncbi:MAG: glycosyltransferase family A protein [Candidatus Thiodiazotropha sp.]